MFGFELWVKSGRAPYGAIPVNEELDQEDHVEAGGDGYPELRVLLELRRRGVESGVGGWIGRVEWRVLRRRHFAGLAGVVCRFGGSGAGSQGRSWSSGGHGMCGSARASEAGCTRVWTVGGGR